MQTCTRCGCSKPIDHFSFKNKAAQIRKTWCKQCVKESSAAYYQKNKEAIKEKTSEYRRGHLDLYAEATNRWRDANPEKNMASLYKWRSENKEAIKAIDKRSYHKHAAKKRANAAKRYLLNHAKALEYARQYRKNYPERRLVFHQNRRARMLSGGNLSLNIIDKLKALQRGRCACCGKPLGNKFHLDHIVPLFLNGTNTDDNVQLLRSECNLKKHTKHPIDYMQSKGYLL